MKGNVKTRRAIARFLSGEYSIQDREDGYVNLTVEDFGTEVIPGKPKLPAFTYHVELPEGVSVSEIETNVLDLKEIDGEYAMEVNIGSTVPRLPQMERSQWMAFLTLLATFPQLALSPSLMREMAQMHHIDNQKMLEELQGIVQQMMSGQMPAPGPQGSQPGQAEMKPQAVQGGQAGGPMSLAQPGAGNIAGE